jgi:toxin ParE1/3/4
MPRLELRYRPAALADLEDIFRAVLRVSISPAVARRYVERVRDRCRRITLLPQGGRLRTIWPQASAPCRLKDAP